MEGQIKEAIALYEGGKIEECLSMVSAIRDSFSDRDKAIQKTSSEVFARTGNKNYITNSASILNWLDLAIDRLQVELGKSNNIALMPVLTCLNTALNQVKS